MSNGAVKAFIVFLQCEAQQSEERAKSLRATAAAIEAKSIFRAVATRKRQRDRSMKGSTTKQGKAHSAPTLFVLEHLEPPRKDQTEQQQPASGEVVSLLARQLGTMSEEEKQVWKFRAVQSPGEPYPTIPGVILDTPDMDDDIENDLDNEIEEENGGKKRHDTRRDGPTIAL